MKLLFISKKLAETMMMPLQFSLVLLVCGVVLLWLKRGRLLGQYLVTVGTVLLLIFSNTFVGYHVAHGLEARYPPLLLGRRGDVRVSAMQLPLTEDNRSDASSMLGQGPFIVVLSGGASDDPELPVTCRLTPESAFRVVEAVQIYRSLASSPPLAADSWQVSAKEKLNAAGTPRVLILGGPTVNSVPEAVPMQELAESLGIPANAILLETRSNDTASEAKGALPFVGHKPFILVTSAFQMPRAVALFQHLGMRPIPAPANYIGQSNTKPFVMNISPNVDALVQSETAFHERLGMLWEHFRGQL